MTLMEFIHRSARPAPWEEGDNLPWNEPGFSERMLKEHLSQAHNHASRRFDIIDQQVDWIQNTILKGQSVAVLDLGCGPGLYTSRLAKMGSPCTGIDFSPASIRYAKETAERENLPCSYRLQDLRQGAYGRGYGLALLLYGEFQVFSPADAALILREIWKALAPGGWLILEPHTLAGVRSIGTEPSSWYTSKSGLFSEQPHLVLEEYFWYEEQQTAVARYAVIEAETGEVRRYSSSYQGYTQEQYRSLLEECGFEEIAFYPSLLGEPHPALESLCAVTARK